MSLAIPPTESFGDELTRHLRLHQLTKRDVARQAGISDGFVHDITSGARTPRPAMQARIRHAVDALAAMTPDERKAGRWVFVREPSEE